MDSTLIKSHKALQVFMTLPVDGTKSLDQLGNPQGPAKISEGKVIRPKISTTGAHSSTLGLHSSLLLTWSLTLLSYLWNRITIPFWIITRPGWPPKYYWLSPRANFVLYYPLLPPHTSSAGDLGHWDSTQGTLTSLSIGLKTHWGHSQTNVTSSH